MARGWMTKALAATLLLAMAAVVSAEAPKHVKDQIEATMLVTGKIAINADGSVSGYQIDDEDKVPGHVLVNIGRWVPGWRFEPVLVDGNAVPARAKMTLRMLARPVGDKFEISIASTSFGNDDAPPTDTVKGLKMYPPSYPADMVSAGGEGTVYLMLKIGRDGKVEDLVVERVNLHVYASEQRMKNFRKRLSSAAASAARRWTFVPPTTGELAQLRQWSVRVPVDFRLGGVQEVAYGEWQSYLPGPQQPIPWLQDEPGSDALAGGALHTLGSGLVLLTPLQKKS